MKTHYRFWFSFAFLIWIFFAWYSLSSVTKENASITNETDFIY